MNNEEVRQWATKRIASIEAQQTGIVFQADDPRETPEYVASQRELAVMRTVVRWSLERREYLAVVPPVAPSSPAPHKEK